MSAPHLSPRRRFEERFALLLVLGDAVSCAAAILLAYLLRSAIHEPLLAALRHDVTIYIRAVPVVAGLWLITFHALGLYDLRRFLSALAEMTAVFRAVTLTTLMVAAASFLSHVSYSRAILFFFWAAALLTGLGTRTILREIARRARSRSTTRARTLVVGCGDLARVVARRLSEHGLLGYELLGFVSVGVGPADIEGVPVVGRLEHLDRLVRQHSADEILVVQPDIEPGELMSAIQACEDAGVAFCLVAGPLQVLTEHSQISGLGDLPVVELPSRRMPAWQSTAKRGLDILISFALLALLWPLMAVVALIVRRETGAGALFLQRRVGHRGVEFTMLKFRTMHPTADPYADSPTDPDDCRVTRSGRWLRRLSLDEWPQLINVLKGDMSLVGPRPEMPYLVALYEPWQRRRLDVKPGITGLWQILGRKDLPLRDNIEYDFYYIRNWSIWLDLSVLLQTIPVVLWGRGAY